MKSMQETKRNRAAGRGKRATVRSPRGLSALLALVMTLGSLALPVGAVSASDAEQQTAITAVQNDPDSGDTLYSETAAPDGADASAETGTPPRIR